jgi:hypothetical protein
LENVNSGSSSTIRGNEDSYLVRLGIYYDCSNSLIGIPTYLEVSCISPKDPMGCLLSCITLRFWLYPSQFDDSSPNLNAKPVLFKAELLVFG